MKFNLLPIPAGYDSGDYVLLNVDSRGLEIRYLYKQPIAYNYNTKGFTHWAGPFEIEKAPLTLANVVNQALSEMVGHRIRMNLIPGTIISVKDNGSIEIRLDGGLSCSTVRYEDVELLDD